MATDADTPLPVCEARGEPVGNFVDSIVKMSVSEVPLQKHNQDDKHNELPMVEGENFLKSPLTNEVHSEANGVAPNVSKVVEKTSAEESQQNAEESNSKDGDGGVVPEKCSMGSSVAITPEMKVGDTIDEPHTDDATGMTQLSKETSSDHHGMYDSSTENVALTKEILLESSLPSEENESHTPCISESKELSVQSKTTDDKSADEKPTEEDMSSSLTNEMTSEQVPLENERNVEENFNTAAEKASYENSASGETITKLETSNGNKLQNESDLNTSLSNGERQQNAEKSNSIHEDGDRGVVPEQCSTDSSVVNSELKVGDTTDDPCTDNATEVPEISKETSSDHPGTCDSSTENIVLTKEILPESSHLSEETESHTPCISEGEELNAQSKIIDDKSADEKPSEEDFSPNLTNKMTSDQEPLEYERSVEDNFNTASEKASHENSTPQETITTLETSNGDKLESKSDLKAPLSKEEETDLQKGDKSVTTSEDHGVTSEKTLSESHEDVECPSKTLEDAATDHNDPKLAEQSEESLEIFPTIFSSSHKDGSMNAVLQEDTNDHTDGKIIEEVDNHKEVVEKTDQRVKDGSGTLVDRPVELAANEETSAKEIQRNAEESNSTDKDGDRDVVPEVCSTDSSVATSEIDTLVDPDMDNAEVVTQLSKDTSSDLRGTNDSFTEDVALTDEILQETDLPSKETESHTPCISEGEEPNVQVKTKDNKSVDEKLTEEDISCNLANEVSKEGESDHNKMTSEQEELENKRSVENSTSGETIITLETSNSDELQSKSDLNSSLSNEQEMAVQKSDEPVTTPVDYGVPSEKTLSESHADVECHSKTLEDAATDHSGAKVTENSEESSVVQVEDSQTDHNENLEEESEGLPLTEASTGGTNDNVSADTGEVKEQDEDHKEVELSESEQSTKCTLVKEDVQIENPAESLHVALENIEVSHISQENSIEVLPEEQSTNSNLHGNTITAEEATIDAAEGQKDSCESFPPIVSGSPKEETMNAVLQEVTSDYMDEKIFDEGDKHEEVSEILSTTVSTKDAEGNSLVKLEVSENKKEDDSEKESEETPLPLPLAPEVSDASMLLHEARVEDGEPKKAEFCDDERDTESMLPKTESRTENTGDVHVDSEDTKAPDSVDKISEGGAVDAAAEKEETVENVPTIIPNEKTEENLCIQVDGQEMENEEHWDKENEQLSSIKDYPLNVNNDEVIVKDDNKIEDEEPTGAVLFDKDKYTESVLLTEELQSEKPVESLHAALEDIKTSDFSQHTEATGILEEQIPAENSQGIPSDETEETGIDAANINGKTQELQNVSNEDSDKDLLIKVADTETKHDINLEEEPERRSLTETSKEEASDNQSILLEPKTSDECPGKVELPNDEKSTDCTTPKKQSLHPEDHKTSTSSADTEKTCSLEKQSLEENCQTIISEKVIDAGAADKHDLSLENVATETPHEHIEENLVTQVDCSAREHEERMEEDNESSSLIEAPEEETDARGSKNINEYKNRVEESITPELENGENTESKYVKKETDVETPIDSLQVKLEDIKQHDSSPDINKSIEEEISNADPREISTDKAERESVDAAHANEEYVEIKDVAKDISDCDEEDSIPIEEVGSQNPLNEASAGNAIDDESTKITEDCLITKEEPLESLQVADQDIETPPLSQDRETSSLDEESPTYPEAIIDDNKEEKPDNATGEEDETPKDKDIVEDISKCGREGNMPTEEVASQNPLNGASTGTANIEESTKITEGSLIKEEASLESLQEAAQEIETPKITEGRLIKDEASLESLQEAAQEIETPHLSREREISSPDEQTPIANSEGIGDDSIEEIADSETGLEGETPKDKNIANTTPYEDKEENMQVQEDCSQQEQNESENIASSEAPAVSCTESSPVKEEEKVEIPTEEQILTANPQETCVETQERTVDAANKNNDVVISVQNGDNEDNSPIEVDGLQETSSEEVPAEKINDDEPTTTHEAEFANENTVKANLNENEEKLECALVKEEVHIESLQVADEEIKDTSSGQDRKASHLEKQASTTDSHETMGDEKYAKAFDSTDLKQETLGDENYAATPDEDTKEDSRNQVDELLLEQEEHWVKDSESTSVSDAPKDDITESTLVKEVAEVEDHIDSSQVATEDIKEFAPCQDTEISSTVEQIIHLEDISSNKITEKTVDATGEETQEAQDIAKSVPREDDSPNEQNTEATLIKEEVSIELPQIVAEDREEPCSSEVRETNSQEEQILCASPRVIINDNEEKKTIDPTIFENETPKDEVPKEMESVDVKGETKEEEGYLKAAKMTTAVIGASDQERSLNLTAGEAPCAEDLNVNKDIIGHIPEVSDEKQQDSPIMEVSEEHIMTSNEHVLAGNSMEFEVSEKINDQVVGEANSCGDKTDLEKIEVLNDGPTAIPTSQTLAEIESRECTEAEVQVPNGEKEAEIKQEAENDQKNIDAALPNYAASENVLESKEVNGEEKIASNNCTEILSSPISVASEEVSTSNVALEEDSTSNSVTDLETKNEQEAPAIKETTPSSAEGQDAEGISVEENSNYVCGLTEEKSDSNEVAVTPGENKSGVESKSNNRGLEFVTQGQSFDIISKTEETKAEEEDLKAAAEMQSDKAVTEDISQEETTCEKETMKEDISNEKEQSPRIKEEHEDIKDYHQGSCEEEVNKDSHQENDIKQDQHINSKETYKFTKNGNDAETVPEVSEEADEKAPEEVEEKIFAHEAFDRILHQEEQATSIEVPTATKIDNENARNLDIACVITDTQDSNKEAVQIAIIPGGESEEQNKEDEICSSDEVRVKDEEILILSEGKSKEEAKETYKEACVEAEQFDLSSQTKYISECAISDVGQDNEKCTTEKFSEEDYPKKITECEVSSASEDIELTEQPSEDASITAEMQEAKAGIDLGAAVPVPEATGLESQEVEELNNKCTEMADASTPDETSGISASKKIGESTEGTPLEAKDQQTKDNALTEQLSKDACITAEVQEAKAGIDLGAAVPVPEATGSEHQEVEELNDKCTEMADTSTPVETLVISTLNNIGESTEGTSMEDEDQQNKLHDLPEESNMRDTEVKMAEIEDAVNLQSVRDISEDVQDQELSKKSFGASNNHNPVEGDPEERTEFSEGQETNPIQAAPVSETLKQEIEEQKLGRDTVDSHDEEKNISNIPNQLESVYGADTEKVPESSIHQSSVENTDQCDKKEGNQQIDSPLVLPHAQCSDIKTSENEPTHVGGLGSADVTELEASPLSLKDKHVVLEADDTRNLILENLDGDKNISTEYSQGEHEVVKPSKVEQEEEECRNEERKDQQIEGKPEPEETDKPSLSELLQVSGRGTSEMADHSPTEKEPTSHNEDMHAENIDEAEHENTKADEEKDEEEESHEQKKSDLGSEAPVMVDIGDADMKVAHKKSHNILSGVGSKVKHSIAKVKKAITGKSTSPKKVTTPESK